MFRKNVKYEKFIYNFNLEMDIILDNPLLMREVLKEIVTKYDIGDTELVAITDKLRYLIQPEISDNMNDMFTHFINTNNIPSAYTILTYYPNVKYVLKTHDCDDCLGLLQNDIMVLVSNTESNSEQLKDLLEHLIYDNIVFKCEIHEHDRYEFDHSYTQYFICAVRNNALDNARMLCINFPVSIYHTFRPFNCHSLGFMKKIYKIYLECKDQITSKETPLTLEDLCINNIDYEIISWYYTIHPEVFTKESMNKSLILINKNNPRLVDKFSTFFQNIEDKNFKVKFTGKIF